MTVLGIPNVKDVRFSVSEGVLGDQPGHSSARFCACNNRVGRRGEGRRKEKLSGTKSTKEKAKHIMVSWQEQ